MESLSDRHTGSPLGGQQNFHSHPVENGNTDSFEFVSMSRDSHGGAVSGMDTQSFSLDASWPAQDSTLETTLGWLLQSSQDAMGSPPASVRTVTSERPVKAQSVELSQSLSQNSHHSGMTDRSLSLPDTGLYPNYNTDNLYSESKYIDEIDSTHGSYHNGDAKGSSRRQSHMMPIVTGSSYPAFKEVMFTSPMDPMSQVMFEPSVTHDGISPAMNPMDMNDSPWPQWDGINQREESEGSTPYSSDINWPAGAATKHTINYLSNHATNSPRYVVIQSVDSHLPHTFYLLGPAGRPWSSRTAVSMEITLPITRRDMMMACLDLTEAIAMGVLTMTVLPVTIRCTRRPL